MLRLVEARQFEPAVRPRPEWLAMGSRTRRRVRPAVIPVPLVRVAEGAPRWFRTAVRVLRAGVLVGALAAAWQIGMVIGAL